MLLFLSISLEDLKDAGFMWNLVARRGNHVVKVIINYIYHQLPSRLMAMPSKLEGPAPRAMSKTSNWAIYQSLFQPT